MTLVHVQLPFNLCSCVSVALHVSTAYECVQALTLMLAHMLSKSSSQSLPMASSMPIHSKPTLLCILHYQSLLFGLWQNDMHVMHVVRIFDLVLHIR